MLQKNIELNDLSNVGLEQAALDKDNGRVVLTFAPHDRLSMTPSVSAYKVEGQQERIEVPAYSLDSYVKKLGKTPDFILMDVEAAELAVLGGAQGTLAKAHPTLLIEIHGWDAQGSHDVARYLSNFGYVGQLLGQRGKEGFVLFQAR
jgi:FkbM family methyltransferase